MTPGPKMLLIGHSHVNCILAGARQNGVGDRVKVINLRRVDIDTLSPETVRELLAGFEPEAVCLCLAGNFHNIVGLLENPRPFSIGSPGSGAVPDIGSDRQMIPRALMRALFLQKAQPELTAKLFAICPDVERLMLNPPPPVADFEHIRNHPGGFADRIEQGPAPEELRLLLYELQTEVYRNLARENGAAFVVPPRRLQTASGFLARTYVNDDPTHGNASYGIEMLSEIWNAMGVPA